MSMLVTLSGDDDGGYTDGPFFLCPVTAWATLEQFCRSLPAGEFPRLGELFTSDRTADTFTLAAELGGLTDSDATPPGVKVTARALLDRIGMGDPGEVCRVTDEDNDPAADTSDRTSS